MSEYLSETMVTNGTVCCMRGRSGEVTSIGSILFPQYLKFVPSE